MWTQNRTRVVDCQQTEQDNLLGQEVNKEVDEEMEVAGTPTIAGVATITPTYIKAQRLELWSAIMIIANAHEYQFAEEE